MAGEKESTFGETKNPMEQTVHVEEEEPDPKVMAMVSKLAEKLAQRLFRMHKDEFEAKLKAEDEARKKAEDEAKSKADEPQAHGKGVVIDENTMEDMFQRVLKKMSIQDGADSS